MRKKLCSRKLWVSIIGFVTAICVIFGVEDIKIEQICALIGALGTLVAYIFSEGLVDSAGKGGSNSATPPPESAKSDKTDSQ